MKSQNLFKVALSCTLLFATSAMLQAKSPIGDAQSIQERPQTIHLEDGTVITGTVISETDTQITLSSKFGETTLNKSDILKKKITVTLKSGDIIIGNIQLENENEIVVKTNYGLITIFKNDIADIQDGSKPTTKPSDEQFTFAQDYLIDIFQDPTGNTLKADTVYISGLSLGYAFNDNFQISTRYDGFIYQNFNLRPKYRFLNLGNWEKQLTASVGFHIHSNWRLTNFHQKQEGVLDYCIEPNDPSTCYYQDVHVPLTQVDNPSEFNYYDDEFLPMLEVFAATTFAKTRGNLNGRYQITLGGSAKFVDGANSYRAYAGFDVDLNKKLKILSEIIYDPFYNADVFSNTSGSVPFQDVYIDIGAIYTFNNNLSIGVHMLPYYFTIYWKQ